MRALVTMTAAIRPDYTVRAIRAVRLAGYRGPILISVDHLAPESDEVVSAIEREAASTRLDISTRVNKPPLGLWGPHNNAWEVYDWAFEERRAELVLAIEDDAIVSPDAIQLCRWFFEHGEKYLFLSLANNTPNEGGDPLVLWETCHINSPWAWCFTETAWRKIRRRWNSKTEEPAGWDWSLQYNMALNRWKALTPAVPRARNIGSHGSSTQADIWWLHHLKDAQMSDGTHGQDYRIAAPLCPDSKLNWSEPWMQAELEREGSHV